MCAATLRADASADPVNAARTGIRSGGRADFSTAIAKVNDSNYGLQAGCSQQPAHEAGPRAAEVGVIINSIPASVDSMPYGGGRTAPGARD